MRRNEPGLGLVRSERAADQRRVVYFLTEAGEQLAKRMLHYAEVGTSSWSVSG